MKRICIFSLLCLCALATYAQHKSGSDETTVRQPDLQTVNDGFFDPTHKASKPKEVYHFAADYRVEAGYVQNDLRFPKDSLRYGFLHGAKIGAVADLRLPIGFSAQVGLKYSISSGRWQQHFRSMSAETSQIEYLQHVVTQHELTIPIRLFYHVPLGVEKWGLFFYTGPQMQIGLASRDNIGQHLSDQTRDWLVEQGVHIDPYDRYAAGEYNRFVIQYGIGGGFEYDRYRLQAGYDFGLNNISKLGPQRLWQWTWDVTFSVKL